MTWKEKSVTVDEDSEQVFKSVLGDVNIDYQGIHRENLKKDDEWNLIRGEMDDEEIFYGHLGWDEVIEVSKKDNFLSYPHIDITIDEEDEYGDNKRLMIFFKDETPDGYDQVDSFFKTVKKAWNAWRQRNKLHTLSYSYRDGRHKLRPDDKENNDAENKELTEGDRSSNEEEDEKQEQKSEQGQEGVSSIIDKALNAPDKLMDKFGS
jgi:hypothetical protein